MGDSRHPRAGLARQSADLVARARANNRRSRELISSSNELLTHSRERISSRTVPTVPTVPAVPPGQRSPDPILEGIATPSVAPTVEDPGMSIATAVALSGVDDLELWLAYVSIGGDRPPQQIRSFLRGNLDLPDRDVRILAQVVNEHFWLSGITGPVLDL